MGGSEKGRDPASDAGAAASTINDWRVDQTKRRFRDRLVEAAGRLAGGARLKGKTRLTHLAKVCYVQPSTLQRQLKTQVRLLVPLDEGDPGQGLPDWQTIYKLVRGTEVPAYLWLYDLGVLSLQDAAALLEREIPAHLLSEEEQAVVAQYRRLGPERRQTWLSIGGLLEAEASAPGPEGPSARGPGPAPGRGR